MTQKFLSLIITLYLIGGCSSKALKLTPPTLPEPLRSPRTVSTTVSALGEQSPDALEKPQTQFQTTPQAPAPQTQTKTLTEEGFMPVFTETSPLKVNIEGLPLPAFINEVFGNLLGVSFELLPTIQQKRDLVTLRVSKPQTPAELYDLAQQVLLNYGVAIQKLRGEDVIRFVPAAEQQATPPSSIATGLTLPEVPPTHRPIFQVLPLTTISQQQIIPWLQKIYQGQPLEILADEPHNAVILLGPPHLVTQAVEVVKVLDQPLMQGQYSLRIEPAFLSASALAQRLTEVLNNQGYTVNSGSIHLLPIDETNALIAFARDAQVLALIRQWSQQLDQFNPQQRDKMSLFFYGVQNTAAEPLANTLNPLLNSILQPEAAPSQKASPKSKAAQTPAAAAVQKSTSTVAAPAQLAVDEHRNALIFSGTGEQWAQLLPVLKEMDQPAKQVLIEATIAEITLDETERRGIEWVINKADLGGLDGQLSTLGLGVGSQGLTYTLSNAGQVRAVLNAFASSKRATILQTPRLLVRSGSSASINVGNEIPTLTSQSVSDIQQGGTSALLQQIQYRSTGVALNITPVVYAGRRIDLTISQQLSESQDTAGGNVSAPVILNRQIDTELTLSDGHSVLLGGMISNNQTDGWNGVPFLSDLPILGQLFRVDSTTNVRTELVVMIIPYIIDDENEATAITEAVKQQLELLPTSKPSAH